ncbi:hypothetical protein EG328_000169 [Venturia inaequalis]|uniref:Bromo domain-containing protein n=1 Tax=Venturia inaequalis TaxID=5025 RepID=A0A8H3VIC6_VENIN|nr:hypothetical protein EG328_000169 [Venturia inaequalis]
MNGHAAFATPISKSSRNTPNASSRLSNNAPRLQRCQSNPNMSDPQPGSVIAADQDPRTLDFRQRYLQSEARLAALFRSQDASPDLQDGQLSQPQTDDPQITSNKPPPPPKKPARAIDEDDYGDDDDEEEEEVESASPLLLKSRSGLGNGIGKPTLERTPSTDQTKNSEDARKQAEEDKEAAEDAAKRRFHSYFYTLENDRIAMIEQQKLDELDRQVEAETSGQPGAPLNIAVATSVPQQGSLSSANLGASSLMLKNLLAVIDKKRHMVHANDAQLRRLISESRKNRSKWASEDKINQEDLYEAAEKVLHELKAMTEHSAPFLQRVSKREAPDYYNTIKNPMDIGTMMKKLKSFSYKSKKEFVEDLHLIWNNCLRYNSDPQHILRKKALIMQKQTDKLVVLIPDLVVRDRAEVEAEERRNASLDAELDGEDSDDEEPIMASRGRKAPSKKSKKGNTTTRKAPPSINEGTPGADTKPQLGSMGSSSTLRNNLLRADSDVPMENGFTPPPGNLTPLRSNGVAQDADSQADPSEGDGTAMGDLAVEPSEDPEADDYEYRIWKQVTKKARATIASERARLFHNDRLNPEEPALLRTKAGMRRWMRQQKKLEPQDEVTADPSTPEAGNQDVPGETLAEGMEGEDDTLLPDYYDPLSAIPEVESQLRWEEDGEGNVIIHAEEMLRMIPKGQFLSPESALTKKIEANMRQMQETRKICTKIGVVKQMQLQAQMYQNQFQKYDPTPFQELDIEPAVVSDDGPLMAPGLCRATLQRSIGKLFFHAGFEEFQPSAMEAMTDTASMFFTNLAQTVAMYTESSKLKQAEDNSSSEPGYQSRFNVEETMLHALDENGLDVEGLDLYVKDDMERQSTKLAVMHERMKAHLAELLRPALDPNAVGADGAGAFNDGSEQFLGGDFAEDIGEDFFGFKELGLDQEFGLASLSVPLHLLQSRMHNAYQAQNINVVTTTGNIMENPPPFEPVTMESIKHEIGIIQPHFLMKLKHNNENPLVEDDELPVKQRFPKPRLPPTGKITSPRKRPIREQQQMAKKKRRLEEGKEEITVNGVVQQPLAKPTGKLKLDMPPPQQAMPEPEKDDDAPGMMSPESM